VAKHINGHKKYISGWNNKENMVISIISIPELLQLAADRHDMKAFYDGLKAVYGPRDTGSIPVCSKDSKSLITGCAGILSHWAEHFNSVISLKPSTLLCCQSYQPGI